MYLMILPNVCAKQLFSLNMESYKFIFFHKTLNLGICDINFSKMPPTLRDVDHRVSTGQKTQLFVQQFYGIISENGFLVFHPFPEYVKQMILILTLIVSSKNKFRDKPIYKQGKHKRFVQHPKKKKYSP